uniref:Uncharacterized protein n=1 Tax=Knipowitschia caucasica TaxID=637954 RepID=A0AAV2MI76_KNICA
MPRTRAARRSATAKERRGCQLATTFALPPRKPNARKGSGERCLAGSWDESVVPNKKHKLFVPSKATGKKLVLFAGDSHLRTLVFNPSIFPEEEKATYELAFSCTPGATARQLQQQVANDRETLRNAHREPSLLCLLAPSNIPTEQPTMEQAVQSFAHLLESVKMYWPQICVLDFPPRLSFDDDFQAALRQAYHRAAAELG